MMKLDGEMAATEEEMDGETVRGGGAAKQTPAEHKDMAQERANRLLEVAAAWGASKDCFKRWQEHIRCSKAPAAEAEKLLCMMCRLQDELLTSRRSLNWGHHLFRAPGFFRGARAPAL